VRYFKASGGLCVDSGVAEYSQGQAVFLYESNPPSDDTLIGNVLYYHVHDPTVGSGQATFTTNVKLLGKVPAYVSGHDTCYGGTHSHSEVSVNGSRRLDLHCASPRQTLTAGQDELYFFEPSNAPPQPTIVAAAIVKVLIRILRSVLGPPA